MNRIVEILQSDQNFCSFINPSDTPSLSEDFIFDQLSYDSHKIEANTLFFAKGAGFKKAYLEQAIEDGLRFYISETDFHVSIPVIVVQDIKQAMSLIAMDFYGNPQRSLKLLAFTGTKGKTTAAYFAYNILKEEFRPAMLSTMNTTLDGEHFFKSTLTTPESLDLFAMMAEAVQNGMTHLIMEVSSQAYLVKRVYGLTFDVGVFLNISPDHIGPIEHPSFEDYFYHKRQLLKNSRVVIVNSDMDYFQTVFEEVSTQDHDFYGSQSSNCIEQSHAFDFVTSGKIAGQFDIQLIGRFNQENALAAGLACLRLGASLPAIHSGIATTTVPGRMEVLTQENQAKVFVDYAHNGDSLQKLLSVVTEHQSGRITLLIGAPGNKGESRRKDFGLLLNQYPAIQVILTADDPNKEDPLQICQEIASYMTRPYRIIVDREQAIAQALSETTQKGDAVIIAGKGADAYQIVNGKKDLSYPGDIVVAQKYL
ncbi:UDP-N-acetylmuramoylalanyl-D-glutamate--L- lysine ligase [Streptococcus sp. DD13]|nr:UDP-N-acetylmuramoylalanyl-D-glutamate--L- lysine ligase [Streptococcus sp. DD13]